MRAAPPAIQVPADDGGHQHGAVTIEVRVRLIEDPQRRAGEHHPGESQSPSLAGGQGRGELIARVSNADIRKRTVDLAGAHQTPQPGLERKILARREFGLQAVAVREIAECRAPRVAVGAGVASVTYHLPLLRMQKSSNHPQQRRLTRAVRA